MDRLHPEKERECPADTCKSIGGLVNEAEIYSRIYFGGVDPDIRREVWPYLLGHYKWNATGRVNRIMTHFNICLRKISTFRTLEFFSVTSMFLCHGIFLTKIHGLAFNT